LPAARSHSAIWSPHDSLTGSPRVAGSKGHAPRASAVAACRHRYGGGDDSAAVVLARVPLSGQGGARRAREGERWGARARRGIDTGLARHGVDTDGAAALRPAPWVVADSTAAAGLERAWEWRLVAKHALAGQEGSAPSFVSACAREPATARPWRRRRRVCELEVWRKRRAKGPASSPGLRCARAGVHAARGRRGPHGRAREHEHERDVNAPATARRQPRRGGSLRLEGLG
jgi:hypothetical protein